MAEEKIIGIDLGTTNSVVAVMEGNEVKVIANQEGNRLTPSVVAFTDKGDRLVGDPAKRQAVTNARRTVYSIKRFMGRRRKEVAGEEKLVPYKITGGPDEPVKVDIDGKYYTPPEISAMILRKLKEAAEAYLGQTVRKAVITVPAYFNDAQRQATLEAAQIAGFDTEWDIEGKDGKRSKQRMRIINEPTAASLAYGLDKKKNERIAVFDLGGGTFDISILDVGDGVFQVEGVNGDTHLGGDDFDQVLIDYIAEEFKKENGIDLRKDQMALQRLKEAAERAKKDLSQQATTDINLPFITADAIGSEASANVADALEVRAAGGSSGREVPRPGAQGAGRRQAEAVRHRRDRDGRRHDAHAEDPVAGEGHLRQGRPQGRQPRRGGGDRRGHPGAQLLLGSKSQILLVDVTPLSLGIETLGGRLTRLIEKNTSIPHKKTETFSTAADNQPAVTISVYQGESEIAKSPSNRMLGEFNLEGIRPAPRGQPQIEVTFDIDTNGVLHVAAKDKDTGKEAHIEIKGSSGLDPAEVERMRKEAEAHAAEDKKKVELIEARNQADQAVFQIEKTLREHGDKLGQQDKDAVQSAVNKTKEAMRGEDVQAIKQATSDLATAAQALAQHVQGGGARPARTVRRAAPPAATARAARTT